MTLRYSTCIIAARDARCVTLLFKALPIIMYTFGIIKISHWFVPFVVFY